MLARTKWHLFAGNGKQGGSAKAMQPETVSHVLARFIDSQWNIRPVNQPRVNTLVYQVLDSLCAAFQGPVNNGLVTTAQRLRYIARKEFPAVSVTVQSICVKPVVTRRSTCPVKTSGPRPRSYVNTSWTVECA